MLHQPRSLQSRVTYVQSLIMKGRKSHAARCALQWLDIEDGRPLVVNQERAAVAWFSCTPYASISRNSHGLTRCNRELPLLHPRLRVDHPPKSLQPKSLLPLHPRTSFPSKTPRSPRCTRPWPVYRPLQRRSPRSIQAHLRSRSHCLRRLEEESRS